MNDGIYIQFMHWYLMVLRVVMMVLRVVSYGTSSIMFEEALKHSLHSVFALKHFSESFCNWLHIKLNFSLLAL
jgi:hypothetical protein